MHKLLNVQYTNEIIFVQQRLNEQLHEKIIVDDVVFNNFTYMNIDLQLTQCLK